MELDISEPISRPISLTDSELKELNFPTKKGVLKDFIRANNLPRFKRWLEDEKGVLTTMSSNEDFFRIWATEYQPPFLKIKDSNFLIYESSVLYNAEGRVNGIDTKGTPLRAKVTLADYVKRTKLSDKLPDRIDTVLPCWMDFNILPLGLEKSFDGNKKKHYYERKITRFDNKSEIYFLGKQGKIKETKLGHYPLTSLNLG